VSEEPTAAPQEQEANAAPDGITVNDRLRYRIPADPAVMYPRDVGALNPPPERLNRQTGDSDADLRALRERALGEACGQAAAECASTFELPDR
jgi:hypothetical protein